MNLEKLANVITLFRALVSLPIMLALEFNQLSLAWFMLFIGGLSDLIDGWIARKGGGGSEWGAQFDPLADKILFMAPLLWICKMSILPIWGVWIYMSRELLITAWRASIKEDKGASSMGKMKTLFLFTSLILILWPEQWSYILFINNTQLLGIYLFWISLILALISGINYLIPQSKSYPY